MTTDINRRDFIRYGAVAAIALAIPTTLWRFASAADLVGGKTVKYWSTAGADNGTVEKYNVNDEHISIACPHKGLDAPPDGSYKSYDLDENHSLIQTPNSGHGNNARSAAEVLRVWKMIAYYGYQGPGYKKSWWKDMLDDLGVAGASLNNESWRVSTIMHVCFSYWWLGTQNPEFNITLEQVKKVIEKIEAKANADGNPERGIHIRMLAAGADNQEIIYWTYSDPSGFLRIRKAPNI